MLKGILKAATVAVCVVAATAAGQDAGTQIPELNMKVVKFAESNKGKQVGNGECWTLAADALTAAGAQRPGADGRDVFDFGRKLADKDSPLPGDIVQFTKVELRRKGKAGEAPLTIKFEQHTGVVTAVREKAITMLHQNFVGNKTVHSFEFKQGERSEGTIEFFRPRAAKAAAP